MSDNNILETRQERCNKLKEKLIENLDLPYEPSDLNDDISLIGSGLGLDSLDILEIVLCVENNFGVTIPESETHILRSLNTLMDFIEEKLYKKPPQESSKQLTALPKLRESVVMCEMGNKYLRIFEYEENFGIDFLDKMLAADILKLRYGKVIDTFLANKNGEIVAETFVANINDKVFVLAETPSAESCSVLLSEDVKDLSDAYSLVSVDGPMAWKVAKDIFGSDILNLSFLSVEQYEFEGEKVYLLRNGKTGEYGYQFLMPNKVKEKLTAKILEIVEKLGGEKCDFEKLQSARLEGNFFNIFAEGSHTKNPLELGLQWTIDFDKESFVGSDIIFKNREDGQTRTLVGLQSTKKLEVGNDLFDNGKPIAKIVAVSKSADTDNWFALATLPNENASVGAEYAIATNGEKIVKIVSRPFVKATSLTQPMEE